MDINITRVLVEGTVFSVVSLVMMILFYLLVGRRDRTVQDNFLATLQIAVENTKALTKMTETLEQLTEIVRHTAEVVRDIAADKGK